MILCGWFLSKSYHPSCFYFLYSYYSGSETENALAEDPGKHSSVGSHQQSRRECNELHHDPYTDAYIHEQSSWRRYKAGKICILTNEKIMPTNFLKYHHTADDLKRSIDLET
jgi:hypothetical protein